MDDFEKAIHHFGINAPKDVMDILFAELDRDGNGSVTLLELNAFLLTKLHSKAQQRRELRQGLRHNSEAIIALLKKWGARDESVLPKDRVALVLAELGLHAPSGVLDRVLEDVRGDHNISMITFGQFSEWLAAGRQSPQTLTHKKQDQLKQMNKTSMRRLQVDNLMSRTGKSEAVVRNAMRKAHGHAGQAALLLSERGKSTSPAASKLRHSQTTPKLTTPMSPLSPSPDVPRPKSSKTRLPASSPNTPMAAQDKHFSGLLV